MMALLIVFGAVLGLLVIRCYRAGLGAPITYLGGLIFLAALVSGLPESLTPLRYVAAWATVLWAVGLPLYAGWRLVVKR